MTEQELHQQRAELWRVNGKPIHTSEEAKAFFDSVGLCVMYPVRSLPLVPSFFAAYAGASTNLPDARHVFADPRNQPAIELVARLLRERNVYDVNLLPESSLLVSAAYFPYIYALFGDRNPKAVPKANSQGGKLSPLALGVYEAIQQHGPCNKSQLQEAVGRELTSSALDRALHELWSILKIMRVDYRENDGDAWDLLYRWSPEVVVEGSRTSVSEAISALLGKYLESVVAATKEEIEHFFSHLSTHSKVREAMQALLLGRELSLLTVGSKTLIHLTPAAAESQPRRHE